MSPRRPKSTSKKNRKFCLWIFFLYGRSLLRPFSLASQSFFTRKKIFSTFPKACTPTLVDALLTRVHNARHSRQGKRSSPARSSTPKKVESENEPCARTELV